MHGGFYHPTEEDQMLYDLECDEEAPDMDTSYDPECEICRMLYGEQMLHSGAAPEPAAYAPPPLQEERHEIAAHKEN